MAKSKSEQKPESEDAIMERMNKALKRMMETPPETHKEMVERRRGKSPTADSRQSKKK